MKNKPFQKVLKRAMDVCGALFGFIVLSPVMVAVAFLVRIFLGSPVLFRQPRPGLDAKPFEMLKFRTMTDAKNEAGELLPDEERLTPLGKFLRSSSLDELPELINVLKGEMSLVGPRPLLMAYLERYTPEQARRHGAKPGITGWAQINGRNAISWEEKFELDVWYVDHQNVLLDIRIIFQTLLKVFKREGISSADHATMPEFFGRNHHT